MQDRMDPTDWQGHRTLIPCGTGLAEAWVMCGGEGYVWWGMVSQEPMVIEGSVPKVPEAGGGVSKIV